MVADIVDVVVAAAVCAQLQAQVSNRIGRRSGAKQGRDFRGDVNEERGACRSGAGNLLSGGRQLAGGCEAAVGNDGGVVVGGGRFVVFQAYAHSGLGAIVRTRRDGQSFGGNGRE